ncbi:Flp pilus assembly protein CpaB [Ralstonia sp. UBA689]|uniref:Flp pilus assembly protein CpaB n=1 Tax=Ralstonia sp. UBA689 TaxID=1947373 RepID=UPI0025EAED72|nr:Flp pilus assembly protein CpaB [Ralstonia sp. UBA689]
MAIALKINRNWVMLGLAVALGLSATFLSNKLLRDRVASIEEEARRGRKMVSVVVAKKDLQRGDTLNADVLAVRQIPADYVHSTAILPNQFDAIVNQRLVTPLKRGEELLEAHTEGRGTQIFSGMLKVGSRALTFPVDEINSISGMLRPGDKIDLIVTLRDANPGAAQGSKDMTFPLLSNVAVLATGQQIGRGGRNDDPNTAKQTFATVTLETTPEDANRIITAESTGKLTAVLRNPEDGQPNGVKPLTASDLMRNSGKRNTVEMIVGGGGGSNMTVTQAQSLSKFE